MPGCPLNGRYGGDKQTWRAMAKIDAIDPTRTSSGIQCCSSEAVPSPTKAHLRSEEHTSELQSPCNLVCRLLLEKTNIAHRHNRPLARLHLSRRNRLQREHCPRCNDNRIASRVRRCPVTSLAISCDATVIGVRCV